MILDESTYETPVYTQKKTIMEVAAGIVYLVGSYFSGRAKWQAQVHVRVTAFPQTVRFANSGLPQP